MAGWFRTRYSNLTVARKSDKQKIKVAGLVQDFRYACRGPGDLVKLREIFRRGFDIRTQITASERCLIFHLLCKGHKWKTVNCLLDGGFNPSEFYDSLDSFDNVIGRSFPLELACRANDLDVVLLLLGRGADTNAEGFYQDETTGDEERFTALTIAIQQANLQMVRTLIAKGADVCHRALTDGRTPLHLACLSSSAEIVTELLEGGAGVNIHTADTAGQTPLGCVCMKDLDIALSLLRSAPRRQPESDNRVLVRYRYLRSQGWRPDTRTSDGRSLLHQACSEWNPATVLNLLREGWDPSLRTHDGRLPLHFIAEPLKNPKLKVAELFPHALKVIELLHVTGVNLDQRTTNGHTLLQLVRYSVARRAKEYGGLVRGILQYPLTVGPILAEEQEAIAKSSHLGQTALSVLIPLILAGASDQLTLRLIMKFTLSRDDTVIFMLINELFGLYTTNYIIARGFSNALAIRSHAGRQTCPPLMALSATRVRACVFTSTGRISLFHSMHSLPIPASLKKLLTGNCYLD